MGREESEEIFEPDMDRIEATIRRVQAQAAASREATTEAEEADDPILATIRRVQEQAEARASDADGAPENEPESLDPIEATIRRVQAQASAAADGPATSPTLASDEVDEDPIEATIRRVQAQAQATSAGLTLPPLQSADAIEDYGDPEPASVASTTQDGDAPRGDTAGAWPSEEQAVEPEPVEIDWRRTPVASATERDAMHGVAGSDPLVAAIAAAEESVIGDDLAPGTPRHDPEPTSWPGNDERLLGDADTWQIAALRLEQGLQDARREIAALSRRVEELQSSNGVPADDNAADAADPIVVPIRRKVADDEWDDRPRVTSSGYGALTPSIMRDPSPQTATAAELEPIEPLKTEPEPITELRPVAEQVPLEERMPRQYRITVEDKRRGVDLVPLHRALQGIDNVREMSLLSYSNGVAMLLLESVGLLDPETLRLAVGRVMAREARIEVHNEQTFVVKIQEE